jgi:hypothetical protein
MDLPELLVPDLYSVDVGSMAITFAVAYPAEDVSQAIDYHLVEANLLHFPSYPFDRFAFTGRELF